MNEIILDDAFISAALLIQNLKVTPFLKEPRRVAFKIEGDIDTAINKIQANESVGILDYIQAIKRLRNSIFLLKSTSPFTEKVRP